MAEHAHVLRDHAAQATRSSRDLRRESKRIRAESARLIDRSRAYARPVPTLAVLLRRESAGGR